MQRPLRRSLVPWFCACLLSIVGCTYDRIALQMEKSLPQDLRLVSGDAGVGKKLGHVTADEKGAVWDSCEAMGTRAMLTIVDEARALGGDQIANVRWIPGDAGGFAKPQCKRRWGFFLFFPLAMTPYFMSATVQADVYQSNPKNAITKPMAEKP